MRRLQGRLLWWPQLLRLLRLPVLLVGWQCWPVWRWQLDTWQGRLLLLLVWDVLQAARLLLRLARGRRRRCCCCR